MKIAKETTVAFTGCRNAKILRSLNEQNTLEAIAEELEKTILSLYKQGYATFLSGMCDGFDLLAAEATLRVRMRQSEIRLVAVIPFQGQELSYSDRDKERYEIVHELANDVVYTSENYHERAFHERNDFLLDNASVIVCYYDGQRGGTMYTVNHAKFRALPIINLYK